MYIYYIHSGGDYSASIRWKLYYNHDCHKSHSQNFKDNNQITTKHLLDNLRYELYFVQEGRDM